MSQSFLRNASWFRRGLREFTRSGYETANRNFIGGDLVADLKGRYYMVTGSNSGIGYCVAFNIAQAGGTVYMVCRNEQRGNAAREEIIRETNNQNVHLYVCNLSNTKDVLRFCSEFLGAASPLDVLVHNAGCMVSTRTMNDDDIEVNFATNTLAIYIITLQLVPILDRSSDPRVVTVSSGGMLTMKLVTENLNSTKGKFDSTFVYAQNKRQQLVIMRHFSQKFVNIHFSSMHPGWADTPTVQTSMPTFHFLMRSKLRTPQQGADTAHWLAVTPRIREFPTGSFFQDRVVVSEHMSPGTHSTEAEEQRLIEQLEEILQRYLPTLTLIGATPLLSQEATVSDGCNVEPTDEPTLKDTQPTDEPTPKDTQPTDESTPKDTQPTDESTPKDTQPTDEPTSKDTQPTDESTPKDTQPTDEPTPKDTQPTDESTPKDSQPTDESTPKDSQPTDEPTPKEMQPTD